MTLKFDLLLDTLNISTNFDDHASMHFAVYKALRFMVVFVL